MDELQHLGAKEFNDELFELAVEVRDALVLDDEDALLQLVVDGPIFSLKHVGPLVLDEHFLVDALCNVEKNKQKQGACDAVVREVLGCFQRKRLAGERKLEADVPENYKCNHDRYVAPVQNVCYQ